MALTTQFAYNGDELTLAKTVGAAATDYLVDLLATLPVVISDTDAVHLYGLDILAEQLAGAERYYYMHDGLGSVRQVLDSAGQIETRYAYDPFGVPLAANEVSNPWQFTGEARDAEVELLYLRARYYQPGTGRFISLDALGGDPQRPSSLHDWVYVENNPINLTDPRGIAPVSSASGESPRYTEPSWDDRDLTWWLYQEMVTNVDGPDANQIRGLWNSQNPLYKAAGAIKWISLVADGCTWDFKDKIKSMVGDTIMLHHIRGGSRGYRWYEHSVPGNIFYGWMGMAVGFPDWMLHVGAAYAEVSDPVHQERGDCTITTKISGRLEIDLLGIECQLQQNLCINPHWWRSMLDEPGNYWNVEFGIRLYKAHGFRLGYTEWLTFLGSHGRLLTPAAGTPDYVGRHENLQFPYHVGYFNGAGCTAGPLVCQPM